ncbi:MAG: hypothetical protein M3Y67_10995, partial [Pseudomonadota bacterium]|nr:hypothetical protein [Pseudomonadota bacterium]
DGTNASFATAPPGGVAFPATRAMLANNADALVGVTFDPSTQAGWYEDLGTGAGGAGWRVTSDATTLGGSVAFAATLPNESVCSPSGDSRIYGRDFAGATTSVQIQNGNDLVPDSYVSITGNVTDVRYLSVNGKATLISGTDTGNVQKIETKPQPGPVLRRLNWRELQLVE